MSKTLLITGGSRGIGAATAVLAAKAGYDVAISYVRHRAAADAVVAAVEAIGRKAVAVQADSGVPADVVRLFAAVDQHFGRLDGLFNNAGIFAPALPLVEIPVDRVERMIAVNTVGAFVALSEAVKRMSTRLGGKGGSIVNMSSMAAKLGGSGNGIDYALSKGAIDTMTVGLAKEVAAEGIRVNAVRPGLIYTEIHASGGQPDRVDQMKHLVPMQRGGSADEVAEAVVWLLSDKASYVTGTLLDVAGGRGL